MYMYCSKKSDQWLINILYVKPGNLLFFFLVCNRLCDISHQITYFLTYLSLYLSVSMLLDTCAAENQIVYWYLVEVPENIMHFQNSPWPST